MKSREILLVVLVVAIALGSGLIGLYLGRSSVQQQAAAPAPDQEAIQEGSAVSAGTTRLFKDAQKTDLAYEIENNRVYQGTVSQGQSVLYFNGTTIFRGANEAGEKLFTVSGDRIFPGPQAGGQPAYTITNNRVREGDENGRILYTIDGERMFLGPNADPSQIVFASNTDLTQGNVKYLLPILADQRF